MKKLKKDSKRLAVYVLSFFKWLFLAAVTGGIGGFVGVAFHISVEKVTELRVAHGWILYLLPVGGIVIAGLYKLCKLESQGTDRVIDSIRDDKGVPFMLAPLIFVSTVITHLLGGSAGREGAALQLGGSIGSQVGKLFRLDEKDMHLVILCGMSSVFSALFGTPITAAVFALEVISVGVVYYAGLVPCLVSGLVAYWISLWCKVEPVRFALTSHPEYTPSNFLRVSLLAALCAL
ncbi:MAG: chloride channel protein, partial [Acutalibacteraceae bacterium]